MRAEDKEELEYVLKGKAWKVYWLLLKSGRSTGRDADLQSQFQSGEDHLRS